MKDELSLGLLSEKRLDDEKVSWMPLFLDFISHLRIDSKDTGPGKIALYKAQIMFLANVSSRLPKGIRHFLFLKARQVGITTISLAVDLFWLFLHPGIQGALVTDNEANRDKFRIILDRFYESLPKSMRVTITKHNRNNLVLANGSVLDYLIAGQRKNANLGRSRGLNFIHGTEVSSWGDEEGYASLMASASEIHPHRLYLFESTAKGFGLYYDLWNTAKDDETQSTCFIGWWAKESYALDESSELFKRYWDGTISDEEGKRIAEVYDLYGHMITPAQLAWFRWKSETRIPTESFMDQEYAWTEFSAFVHSGQTFFPNKKIGQLIMDLDDVCPPFQAKRYHLGEHFDSMQLETVDHPEEADLKIWEEPVTGGVYAIGVDPAYGRSDNKDRHVIEVWRCYADRMIQVAEFATYVPETYQITWVMAHLAGSYTNCVVNLEISGPGHAIMQELRHLRQMFDAGLLPGISNSTELSDVFACVRWYMYHRPDSMGAGYLYNWKTTQDNKLTILNQMRDSFVLNMLEVRSRPLAFEMRTIVQDGASIEASGRNKDDRVFATALAHKAWVEWLRPDLLGSGMTHAAVLAMELERETAPEGNILSTIITGFFKQKEFEREARES